MVKYVTIKDGQINLERFNFPITIKYGHMTKRITVKYDKQTETTWFVKKEHTDKKHIIVNNIEYLVRNIKNKIRGIV